MVVYTCNNCNKIFTQKVDYTRHLNRKNPCKKMKLPIIAEKPFIPAETVLNKSIICNYCFFIFTRKDSLSKHLKKYCKVKKQDDHEKETIYQQLLNEHLNIKNENKDIKNENKDIKNKLTELENKILKGKIINTKNINNGIINNIQIVAYGKEDLSRIKEKVVV
jgi:uncharacterized C2H2 Zn-finger protein